MAPMPSASRDVGREVKRLDDGNARMAVPGLPDGEGATGRAWGLIARGAGSLRLVKRQPKALVAQHEHWPGHCQAHPVLYGTAVRAGGICRQVFNADGVQRKVLSWRRSWA